MRCRVTVHALAWAMLCLSLGGCCWCGRDYWHEPVIPDLANRGSETRRVSAWQGPPDARGGTPRGASQIALLRRELAASRDPWIACELAESLCAQAAAADRQELPDSSELYYQAAGYSWIAVQLDPSNSATRQRAREIYHAALARMLVTVRRDGRYRSGVGLQLGATEGAHGVPLATYGFSWKQDDFQELVPVGEYESELVSRRQSRPGWGVPVVVLRSTRTGGYVEERFLFPRPAFVGTVILRPDAEQWLSAEVPVPTAVLECYNPRRVTSIDTDGVQTPLAADLSAAFALASVDRSSNEVNPLLWFLEPDKVEDEGLLFLEPYQPGKIPVVLVHGLISSPRTWLDMANDLLATPGFEQQFQIWAFRYPTGRAFLGSAAHLRRDMQAAVATVDPSEVDPAMQQMVLVGHSMGGLIVKLQVVASGDALWHAVASQPLAKVKADDETRTVLAEAFYFEPLPFVRRVVFIATPHGGSSWAARPVGRVSASLVRHDSQDSRRFRQLIADNPEVFSGWLERRFPTSIDLLNRRNELLQTIYRLPIQPPVHAHSVIGTGKSMCVAGPADGIVPVASARLPDAESEFYVDATHTWIHRRSETVAELARILRLHAAECGLAPGKQGGRGSLADRDAGRARVVCPPKNPDPVFPAAAWPLRRQR